MALATSIFYSQGKCWLFCTCLDDVYYFFIFSHEMSHKAGFEFESYKDRSLKDLVSGIGQTANRVQLLPLYSCFFQYCLWNF